MSALDPLLKYWSQKGLDVPLVFSADAPDLEGRIMASRRDEAGVVYLPDGLTSLCVGGVHTALSALNRGRWQVLALLSTPGASGKRRRGDPVDIEASGLIVGEPSSRLPHPNGEILIYQRTRPMNIDITQGPIKGLIAATRTTSKPGAIGAWLDYYLRFCERAVVLVHMHPGDSYADIQRVVAPHADRVVLKYYTSPIFDNWKMLGVLSETIKEETEGFAVIHTDSDEFLSSLSVAQDAVQKLSDGQIDYAQGWMACRLAPGCHLYYHDSYSYEQLKKVAPVRSCVIKEYGAPNLKVWLTRWPILKIHDPEARWKGHGSMVALDHFRWTPNNLEIAKEKAFAFLVRHGNSDTHHWARAEVHAVERSPEFIAAAKKQFHPLSDRLAGWFNYHDVYRQIAEEAPEGATFVEVGVWRGKSLGYIAEYATLLGKKLNCIGYDQFNPAYRLGTPEAGMTAESWQEAVQLDLIEFAPWNSPAVVRADSADSAEMHEDGSVFAVWIDAGHEEADVIRDVRAWLPKVKSGGILAGHDYHTHAGVRSGLRKLKLDVKPVSQSSWFYRVP